MRKKSNINFQSDGPFLDYLKTTFAEINTEQYPFNLKIIQNFTI